MAGTFQAETGWQGHTHGAVALHDVQIVDADGVLLQPYLSRAGERLCKVLDRKDFGSTNLAESDCRNHLYALSM
jgi:hypothetical protein